MGKERVSDEGGLVGKVFIASDAVDERPGTVYGRLSHWYLCQLQLIGG